MRKLLLSFLVISLLLSACRSLPVERTQQNAMCLKDKDSEPEHSVLMTRKLSERVVENCPGSAPGHQLTRAVYEYKEIETPEGKIHLRAYVHIPAKKPSQGRAPAVAFFHGGAWRGGNPLKWFPAAAALASRGIVTVAFQYRLQNVHHTTPASAVADVRSALRWLRKNSAELGIDESKISAVGDSAGGYLALSLLFVSPDLPEPGETKPIQARPAAAIAYYPVIDMNFPEIQCGELSLLPHNESGASQPILILHGTADKVTWTPFNKSQAFCDRLNSSAGNVRRCALEPFIGQDHDFIEKPFEYRRSLKLVADFLAVKNLAAPSIRRLLSAEVPWGPVCEPNQETREAWRKEYGYTTEESGLW